MAYSPAGLLAHVLTGDEVVVGPDLGPATEFLRQLAAAGWPADRVRTFAHSRWAADEPWPLPVPPGTFATGGAAQWYAALGAARAELGLDAYALPPSRRTQLTPDEQRLLLDVPPHHGSVG